MQTPPAVHPRQTGGFNQGLGDDFSSEHLSERSNDEALQHQTQLMQDAQAQLPPSGEQPKAQAQSQGAELKQIGPDLLEQLKDLLNFKKWLGLEDAQLTPEQKAKAQLIHQRWLQLDAEQQQVALRLKQERQAQKKRQEEEELRREEAEKQSQGNSLVVPTSKHTGPADAVSQLSQNRQQLSGPANAN